MSDHEKTIKTKTGYDLVCRLCGATTRQVEVGVTRIYGCLCSPIEIRLWSIEQKLDKLLKRAPNN